MKPSIYMFEYSTKTCSLKRIAYCACSLSGASKKFRKNTRWIELFDVRKVTRHVMTEEEVEQRCTELGNAINTYMRYAIELDRFQRRK